MKVGFLDSRVYNIFKQRIAAISAFLSTIVIFYDIPDKCKLPASIIFILSLALAYICIFIWANRIKDININIDGTNVIIKTGDIFLQSGLKAIAFNEYFDTQVDNKIISENSLNGIFIRSYLDVPVKKLDRLIDEHQFEADEISNDNKERASGKKRSYRLGTIFVHNEYLLTAMSKFDDSNRAVLTMPEYLEFLIRFWDRINKVYAQKNVVTPIFGSGITRIKGHKNISDEDLLKIMLWTFRISEMRFKHPANLTIIVHKDKIDQINLLDIKMLKNGV